LINTRYCLTLSAPWLDNYFLHDRRIDLRNGNGVLMVDYLQ
jgi:hypothetical protein